MRRQLERMGWATAFLAVLLAPALLAPVLYGPQVGRSTTMLSGLSVVIGLLATSALVCVVVLPSRVRSLTRALGIESVINIHRFVGLAVTLLVGLHVVLVVLANPANLALFDIINAPGRARAAVGATVGLGALVALTLLRRRLQHRYEVWRWVHVALAGSVLVLSALHIWWLNHLVRDPLMRVMFILLAFGVLVVLGYRWLWLPAFGAGREYVVREVRPESASVSTLVLEPRRHARNGLRRGYRTLEFEPGQFAWLRLSPSVRAQEHPFTIASSAHLGLWTEFTIRHTGDFTNEIRTLRLGDSVWVDGPHGAFTLDLRRTTGLVMIAGGVGITPMMSMLRTLAHRRDQRPHRLVVVAGTLEDLLFRSEIQQLGQRLDLTVVELLRRPPPSWTGATGSIDEQLLTSLLPGKFRRDQLDYYLCGPPAMVADVLSVLDHLDVPHPRIHTEQFDLV
ncbi:MAG TPA: ferric reductase-like transmembrane domain-containing protein [Pseudonocardiaceae bacterium]|nr:ferric reductase-like transmembrane domain-containing protein [Pseudonocardiaceae bacterium]